MVTTKRIAKKYAQKKIRMEFKHFTAKNLLNTKEHRNTGNEGQR